MRRSRCFALFALLSRLIKTSFCQLQGVPGLPDCYVLLPSLIGDGNCDNFPPYNEVDCGYDGGDCKAFNDQFPGCNAPITELVTDGKCQNVYPYNTSQCDFDAGSCKEFQSLYPGCYVLQTDLIGNGQCQDFEPYNTEACGYDGGDCNITLKRDLSNRNTFIGCGAVLMFVTLVGVETWELKRRRRTEEEDYENSDSDYVSEDDAKVLVENSIPVANNEIIDVLNLSAEQPSAAENEGGDIEEGLNIEMPVEPEQKPNELKDSNNEEGIPETTSEIPNENASIDSDTGLYREDDGSESEQITDDVGNEDFDNQNDEMIIDPQDEGETAIPKSGPEIIDLGGDLPDELQNQKGIEDSEDYDPTMTFDSDEEVTDDDLINLKSSSSEIGKDANDDDLINLESDDTEDGPDLVAEIDKEDNTDNDFLNTELDEEEVAEGGNSEEESESEPEAEDSIVELAQSKEEKSAKIEEALKFLEMSESSESELSTILKTSSDETDNKGGGDDTKSEDTDATENADNRTPVKASLDKLEIFRKEYDGDEDDNGSMNEDDFSDEDDEHGKKKRFANYGLLSSLVNRHKKRLLISRSESSQEGSISSPPNETKENSSNDTSPEGDSGAKKLSSGDDGTDTDSHLESKLELKSKLVQASIESGNESSDVDGFSDIEESTLEDVHLSPRSSSSSSVIPSGFRPME